jgi:hypothetical protein
MDRQKLLRSWLFAMTRLEVQLRVEHSRARNAMVEQAAKEYSSNGHPPTHVFVTHRNRVKGLIEDHYRRTIPVFSKLALGQIKSRRVEKKAAQTIYESLVAQWISKESLRKSQLIADTDRDDVINAISAGVDEGLGTEEIARNIRQVSDMTPFRAATVARTETQAAASFGSIESVREAERQLDVKMLKSWLPTLDNRTRPEHAAMAGSEAIPLDAKFVVGGEEMDRPGDTSASSENVINCRCALAYEEAE